MSESSDSIQALGGASTTEPVSQGDVFMLLIFVVVATAIAALASFIVQQIVTHMGK